jgi:hypothetical protein
MLLAVDTNLALDLAAEVADALDALCVIQQRIKGVRLIVSPTVCLELAYLAEYADEAHTRAIAIKALRSLAERWKIHPLNLIPVGHGIVEIIGERIRADGLLPEEEVHDAFILAESALLGASMLLTSDAHLRGIDHPRLTLLLSDFDVAAPIIATPREIVGKFYR